MNKVRGAALLVVEPLIKLLTGDFDSLVDMYDYIKNQN